MPAYAIPASVAKYLVDYHYATQAEIDEKGTDVLNTIDAGVKPFFLALMYQAAAHDQLNANLNALDASNDQITMNNAATTNWATRGQIATSVWPTDPKAQADLAALLNADSDSDSPPPLPAAVPALQDPSVADSTTLSQKKASDIENRLAEAIAAEIPPPPANDSDLVAAVESFKTLVTYNQGKLSSAGIFGPAMPYLNDAYKTFTDTLTSLQSSGLLTASGSELNAAVKKFHDDVVAVQFKPGATDPDETAEAFAFLTPLGSLQSAIASSVLSEANAAPPPLTTPWPTSGVLQQALSAWLSRQGVPATVWTPGQALTLTTQGPMNDFFNGQKSQLAATNDAWTGQIQLQLPQMQQANADYASATTAGTAILDLLQRLRSGLIANVT